jgi:hypothetical protein
MIIFESVLRLLTSPCVGVSNSHLMISKPTESTRMKTTLLVLLTGSQQVFTSFDHRLLSLSEFVCLFLCCCSSLYYLNQFDLFSFQRTYPTPPSTLPIVNVHVSSSCRVWSFSRRRIRRHHSWFRSPLSSFTVKPLTTVLFLLLK